MMATNAATLPSVIAIGRASANKLSGRPGLQHRRKRRQQHQRRAPSRCPRRSASRPRCGRARSRAGAAPAWRAAARPCSRPTSARPNTMPAPIDQPSHHASPMPSDGRDRDLRDRAGDGDAPDREQVLEREMQPDAEHQQNDADLGEFVGDALVGDESGRERTDEDARPRDSPTSGENRSRCASTPKYESEHQGDDDGRDQRRVVRHRQEFLRSAGAPPLIPARAPACPFLHVREFSAPMHVASRYAPVHHGTMRASGVWGPPCRVTDLQGNSVRAPSPAPSGSSMGQPVVLGVACGAGAALFWAAGFVAARHGIAVGFSPADIVFIASSGRDCCACRSSFVPVSAISPASAGPGASC